jgi:uncharacterized protein
MIRCLLFVVCVVLSYPSHSQKIPLIRSGEVIKEGVAAYDSGNFEAAIKKFLTITERDTNYIPMLAELAVAYTGAKEYNKAIEVCDRALAQSNTRKAALMRSKAIALDRLGGYDKSLALFEHAIAKYPGDYMLHFHLGVVHYNNKAYDKAKDSFFRALSINPYHANSHFNLASISISEGRKVHAMLSMGLYLTINEQDNRRLVLIDNFLKNEVESEGEFTATGANAFEKLDQIIRAKMALTKQYKTKVPVDAAVVKQYEMLFEQLDLNTKDVNDPWVAFYMPIYTSIKGRNFLEPFIYHILSSSSNDQVKKWSKKNGKILKDYYALANSEIKVKRARPRFISAAGFEENITAWYGDNGEMVSVGYEDNQGRNTGSWVFFHPNGERSAEGRYSSGNEKAGIWKYYYDNGNLKREENFDSGEVTIYHETGEKHQRFTVKDKEIDGVVEIFYKCGQLLEKLDYKKGKAEGKGETYYTNGKLQTTYQQHNGQLTGEYVTYFENGNVKSRYQYKEGKLDGPGQEYYINGVMKRKGDYENDELEGPWEYYYSNGKPDRKGSYVNSRGAGEWSFYNERGELIEKRFFTNDGKFSGENTFYKDGRIVSIYEYKGDVLARVRYFDIEGKVLGDYGNPDGNFAMKTFFDTGELNSEGVLRRGQNHGTWKYYYRHGQLLSEYNYEEGALEGKGVEFFPSGDVKVRSIHKDNKLHGYYQEFFVHGQVRAEGWYQFGQRQQQWLIYLPDGAPDSDEYFVNGVVHGESRQIAEDGKVVSATHYSAGGAISDIRHYNAKGDMYTLSRDSGPAKVYETHYANKTKASSFTVLCGAFSDRISRWYPDGKVFYQYPLLGDKRHGKYTYFGIDNNLNIEGEYVYGDQEGTWKGYYDNGKLEHVGHYREGSYDSTWTYFYYHGTLSSKEEFLNDKRNGLTKVFAPDGSPAIEKLYDKSDLISFRTMTPTGEWSEWQRFTGDAKIVAYYANGKKSIEEEYMKKYYHGTRRIYFPNGKLYSEVAYDRGDNHGPFSFYYANGNIRRKGEYRYDELHGLVETFNEDGTRSKLEEYHFGTRAGKGVVYNKNGKHKEYRFRGGMPE